MKRIFVSTLLASMTMICSDAVADTYVWNGLGISGRSGTSLNTPGNWLVGTSAATATVTASVAPGSSDDVIINTSGYDPGASVATIRVTDNLTVKSLTSTIGFGGSGQKRLYLEINNGFTLNVVNDLTMSC
ncbi:MAG: hypothetical protein ACKOA1_08835, partial [Bacteroidota bacterium]